MTDKHQRGITRRDFLNGTSVALGAGLMSPWVIGRQPFGRIHIANSDAGASAMTQSAIGQARRAVDEI